ncbi:hypothetical protein BLA29_013220 [Euroglyphus maynei]|uniref:Uncharacterized protein n=1 Tax=Euroglyphus maynei TaxID=6958 RepID=A0A1Y3ALV9_EURMA|nr:hypothetical protein BLA29_013220 [Euroglyphus maynei]
MEKYSLKNELTRKYLSTNDDDGDGDGDGDGQMQSSIRPDRLGGIQELIALVRKSNKKSVDSSNELARPQGQFNWITTSWSNCTIPCGGFGFKVFKDFTNHICRKLTFCFIIDPI